MPYYVMVCEGKYPIMPIAKGPGFLGTWMGGEVITDDVPQPLFYTLDQNYPGSPKAMYDEEAVPVVRNDVIEVLRKLGVDNIQYFDAVVVDPVTGREHRDYKAFNIVGLVACASAESEQMGTSDSTLGDVDFHSLVIDESRTRGLLLFRLAENVSAIVVHERVKQAIEDAGIPGFYFYGPGEWSG